MTKQWLWEWWLTIENHLIESVKSFFHFTRSWKVLSYFPIPISHPLISWKGLLGFLRVMRRCESRGWGVMSDVSWLSVTGADREAGGVMITALGEEILTFQKWSSATASVFIFLSDMYVHFSYYSIVKQTFTNEFQKRDIVNAVYWVRMIMRYFIRLWPKRLILRPVDCPCIFTYYPQLRTRYELQVTQQIVDVKLLQFWYGGWVTKVHPQVWER